MFFFLLFRKSFVSLQKISDMKKTLIIIAACCAVALASCTNRTPNYTDFKSHRLLSVVADYFDNHSILSNNYIARERVARELREIVIDSIMGNRNFLADFPLKHESIEKKQGDLYKVCFGGRSFIKTDNGLVVGVSIDIVSFVDEAEVSDIYEGKTYCVAGVANKLLSDSLAISFLPINYPTICTIDDLKTDKDEKWEGYIFDFDFIIGPIYLDNLILTPCE